MPKTQLVSRGSSSSGPGMHTERRPRTGGRRGPWGKRLRTAARSPTSPGQNLHSRTAAVSKSAAAVAAPAGGNRRQLPCCRMQALSNKRPRPALRAAAHRPLHPALQPMQHTSTGHVLSHLPAARLCHSGLTYKRPAPHHQRHSAQEEGAALVVFGPAGKERESSSAQHEPRDPVCQNLSHRTKERAQQGACGHVCTTAGAGKLQVAAMDGAAVTCHVLRCHSKVPTHNRNSRCRQTAGGSMYGAATASRIRQGLGRGQGSSQFAQPARNSPSSGPHLAKKRSAACGPIVRATPVRNKICGMERERCGSLAPTTRADGAHSTRKRGGGGSRRGRCSASRCPSRAALGRRRTARLAGRTGSPGL